MKDFSHLNHETKVAIDAFLKHAKLVTARSKSGGHSEKTFQEYVRVAKKILKRCSLNGQSIDQYFAGIDSKSTFYKSTAAVKSYVTNTGIEAVKVLIDSYLICIPSISEAREYGGRCVRAVWKGVYRWL